MTLTDISSGNVVLILHQISGQTKVTDLHQLPLTDQNIPCCQVSVDTLQDTQHVNTQTQHVNTQTQCMNMSKTDKLKERCLDRWSYVLFREEVHGLRDLEGEAKEVVESQERRVIEKERRLLLVWKKMTGRVTEADRQTETQTDCCRSAEIQINFL